MSIGRRWEVCYVAASVKQQENCRSVAEDGVGQRREKSWQEALL